jgi:hypothetical protein
MKGPRMWNVTLLIISIVYISCIYRCIIRWGVDNRNTPNVKNHDFELTTFLYVIHRKD